MSNRNTALFAVIALIAAGFVVRYFNQQPAYIDSFYHYNGATRIIGGQGFSEPYLWTYIGAPDHLPVPSNLYWMPGTALVSALGMIIVGANYAGAQIGLTLCLWGAMLVTYWLGLRYGTRRHAWLGATIMLFCGFFLRSWGQTDTFAPYALFGSLALLFIGLGISADRHQLRYWLLAGACAALGHLTRSDGLLLLLTGWAVLFWVFDWLSMDWRKRLTWAVAFTLAYGAVMSPFFIRNLTTVGSLLPTGGTQSFWYTEYNQLFNYPPEPERVGWEALWQVRQAAIFGNDGILISFVAYEGLIVLTPFIFIGLWRRRHNDFWRGVWIFALGIHLAFALVFPLPGVRGGVFHAVVALMPFWIILALLGLDDAISWVARRRKTWNPRTAQPIMSYGMTAIIVIFSWNIAQTGRSLHLERDPQFYQDISANFAPDTRLMINDTPQLYYYTGIGGVVVPNASPAVAYEIAQQYDIDYLLLERHGTPPPMRFASDDVPPFLRLRDDIDVEGARIYEFIRD